MTARMRRRQQTSRALLAALALVALVGMPSAVTAADDVTPPTGDVSLHRNRDNEDTITFALAYSDPESALDKVFVSCDGGPEAEYPYATRLTITRMDPEAGGCSTFGQHEFHLRILNGAGLEAEADVTGWTEPFLTFEYPLPARTGKPFTVQPVYHEGFVPHPDTVCRWEFRWGSTTALRDNETDETFGGMLFEGMAKNGYCGTWTFTLPWVPVQQYEVTFDNPDASEPDSDTWEERQVFTAAVYETDRRIHDSNLPIAHVLPSTYTPMVGVPITYTRYLVGGATACCEPRWSARLGSGENPIIWEEWTSSSTFTITPPTTGDILVGWDTQKANGTLLAAYYDPPVRRRDRTDPNTSAPVQRLTGGTSSTTAPVRVTWKGSDVGWGIASYKLQRSVNGGAWKTVTLSRPKATEITQNLAYGTSYRYRVRATDKAGNVGSWDYGPTFTPRRASETSASVGYKSGAWSTVTDATAHNGSLRESGTAGAWARYTFRGRDIAWIAERGPGHGKAKVYVDGTLVKTVDLTAASDQPRRIVFAKHWSTKGEHTIKVVVSGTSGRPIVSVDGFALLR